MFGLNILIKSGINARLVIDLYACDPDATVLWEQLVNFDRAPLQAAREGS